jgi:hypothetical protein
MTPSVKVRRLRKERAKVLLWATSFPEQRSRLAAVGKNCPRSNSNWKSKGKVLGNSFGKGATVEQL